MGRTFPLLNAACVVALVAAIAPAIAQFPPGPDDTQDPAGAGSKSKRIAAANGPSIAGNWIGQVTQIGSETPYKLELKLNAAGGETRYPDLDCTGKLTRVGASKSYVFFVEVITKGATEKGGRCPDGTMTVARQGEGVAVGWFGAFETNTIVAFGTLKKK
jgi:hypothetical protein